MLAGAFFRRSGRTLSAFDDGDALSGFALMILLDLPPVRKFFFRLRRFGERQGRIDPELAVVRWTVFVRFQVDVLARTAQHLLKDRDHRGEVVVGEFAAEPLDEF